MSRLNFTRIHKAGSGIRRPATIMEFSLHQYVKPENMKELHAIHKEAPPSAIFYVTTILGLYLFGLLVIFVHHMNSSYGKWRWTCADAWDELRPHRSSTTTNDFMIDEANESSEENRTRRENSFIRTKNYFVKKFPKNRLGSIDSNELDQPDCSPKEVVVQLEGSSSVCQIRQDPPRKVEINYKDEDEEDDEEDEQFDSGRSNNFSVHDDKHSSNRPSHICQHPSRPKGQSESSLS